MFQANHFIINDDIVTLVTAYSEQRFVNREFIDYHTLVH
jgi:hypothetical protein